MEKWLVTIGEVAGKVPELVWTRWRREKFLILSGIELLLSVPLLNSYTG
jgi:hypothetical protein